MYPEYLTYKNKKSSIKREIVLEGKTPTPSDIEGPFYMANAPFRNILTDTPTIILTGRVFDIDGSLLSGAILDFWQANANGIYDMEQYYFRGKIKVDAQANYTLKTLEPGDYQIGPNEYRCSHIHVKVSCNGYKLLTTQLYFYGDKYNTTDHWFNPAMIIDKPNGFFDFVLEKV